MSIHSSYVRNSPASSPIRSSSSSFFRAATARSVSALIVGLLTAFPALAASAEEHAAGGGSDFLGRTVNFLILFGGLAVLLRKPLRAFLAARAREIADLLRGSEAARRQAEQESGQARERLAHAQADVESLNASARADAAREKERIAALAGEESRRIRQLAREEIEHHLRASQKELRSYGAEKAAALAAERLRTGLTADDHRRLIDRSIDQLENIHERPGPG